MNKPLIVAHRGGKDDAVENSAESFSHAIRVGADMIEFDVRRTADRELIAFHDDVIDGTPVASLSRAGIEQRTGHLPLLLDEALELSAGQIALDIEIKEDGYVDEIVSKVRASSIESSSVVFTSFIDSVVVQCRNTAPEIRTGLLIGRESPEHVVRTRVSEIALSWRRLKRCDASFSAPYVTLARFGGLWQAQSVNRPAWVWTVNQELDLRGLVKDSRVEAIITDVPGMALRVREAHRRRVEGER